MISPEGYGANTHPLPQYARSHLQGCPSAHGAASVRTVPYGADFRFSWMPAFDRSPCRTSDSCWSASWPLVYRKSKLALAPAGTPAPHWDGPLPGSVHVETPFGVTVQPWLFSSSMAASG